MTYSSNSVFCFLDESGTLNRNDVTVTRWGLGVLLHPRPEKLIDELHDCFICLADYLRKDPTRVEFHFHGITLNAAYLYVRCLDALLRDVQWRFFYLVIDKNDPKYIVPHSAQQEWAKYLHWTGLLLKNNLSAIEQVTLIADYYNKPAGNVADFGSLQLIVPQVRNVLQVESHGVHLVQMADVLLGGALYKGNDKAKKMVSEKVKEIQKKLGRNKFNDWKIKFR